MSPPSPTSASPSVMHELVTLLTELAPNEGYNLTALPDVRLLRSNRPMRDTPVLYDPGIVIVCQGRKRGYLGEQLYLYDALQYLAVSVPVPFTMQTDASAHEPLLAVYLHLDLVLAADLMVQIDQSAGASSAVPLGMVSSPLGPALAGSLARLLEALRDPLAARLLGRALVREIYFHVLVGPQGPSLRAALAQQGQFGKIARAIRLIHASYNEALDVELLAREAGMSMPTFHSHFKAITHTSPIQYIKSIRLHQARLLMAQSSQTAAAASIAVGYESSSQFSREFKRLFGRTPIEEVQRMRADFAVPPARAESIYVSSH